MSALRIFTLCALFLSGCATSRDNAPVFAVVSERTGLRLYFTSPHAWTGPGKHTWPSHEEWSFSKGTEPSKSFISVRVDRPLPRENSRSEADSQSDAKVEENLRDMFVNPRVKTVAYIQISGKNVRFRKVLNVSGAKIYGGLKIYGIPVSFDLVSDSGKIRADDQKAFFDFVRSVSLEP